MNRTRALIVSVAVALVAVTGAYALNDTLAIGKQTNATTDNEVASGRHSSTDSRPRFARHWRSSHPLFRRYRTSRPAAHPTSSLPLPRHASSTTARRRPS